MKPIARSLELLVEELGDEAVIYDRRTTLVHHLDERAHRIWKACDGRRTAPQIARQAGCDHTTTQLTLDKLHDAGLLVGQPRSRLRSRRQILKAGAALATLPVIASVTAPTPAMAQSLQCVTITYRNGPGACRWVLTGPNLPRPGDPTPFPRCVDRSGNSDPCGTTGPVPKAPGSRDCVAYCCTGSCPS